MLIQFSHILNKENAQNKLVSELSNKPKENGKKIFPNPPVKTPGMKQILPLIFKIQKRIKSVIDNSIHISINEMCFLKDGRLASSGKHIVIYSKTNYHSNIIIKSPNASPICGLKNGCLASGEDRLIKVYKIHEKDFEVVQELKGHTSKVNKIRELQSGWLSSCSDDESIIIWRLDSNDNYICNTILKGHNNSVCSVLETKTFLISSSSGHFYNEGSKKCVKIWDKSTYQCVTTIENLCCYSENALEKLKDDTIIVGDIDQILKVDVSTFNIKHIKNKSIGEVNTICELKDHKILVGNDKKTILYFNLSNNKLLFHIRMDDFYNITCILKHDNNVFVSLGNDFFYFSCFFFLND